MALSGALGDTRSLLPVGAAPPRGKRRRDQGWPFVCVAQLENVRKSAAQAPHDRRALYSCQGQLASGAYAVKGKQKHSRAIQDRVRNNSSGQRSEANLTTLAHVTQDGGPGMSYWADYLDLQSDG